MRDNSIEALRRSFPLPEKIASKKIKSEDDVYEIVSNPSYRDFTPRTVRDLKKEEIEGALRCLAKRVFKYVYGEEQPEYEAWHSETCEGFISNVKKLSGKDIQYGKAQKILNMTMKYLLCMQGSEQYRTRFQGCHMPLDTYTLEWFCDTIVPWYEDVTKRSVSVTEIKENSWSKLERGSENEPYTYLWIQQQIRDYLNSKANTKYLNKEDDPLTPFEAEFYIWPEQKFKKTYKEMIGQVVYESDYPSYSDPELKKKCDDLIEKIQAFREKLE